MRVPTTALFALRIVVALAIALPIAQARNAPNPVPSHASLTPTSTNQVLYDVADMVGNFDLLGADLDQEVYVWDIGLALCTGGVVLAYHYEYQSANDYVDFDGSVPSGCAAINSISYVGGTGKIWFTDGNGRIQVDLASSFTTEEIGPGGEIDFAPGHEFGVGRTLCGISGGIKTCDLSYCGGNCTTTGGGWCNSACGTCPKVYATVECSGACGGGRDCQNDGGGMGGGCGCQ